VSPIRDESGTIIGASKIARDISERARHEGVREELLTRAEQARAEAERANRVKDEFLATLSHELRSPLNAISGWSQLAAAQLNDVSSPIVRRALDVIAGNVTLQLRLINDLLDVSSILNGKLPLRTDTVDIAAVVGAVVDGVRPEAAAKGVHVQLRLNAGRPHVIGDAARLQQIVWNLLSNALKFTPADGRIIVTLGRSAAGLRISVQDTGEGISADFLPMSSIDFVRQIPRLLAGTVGLDWAWPSSTIWFTLRADGLPPRAPDRAAVPRSRWNCRPHPTARAAPRPGRNRRHGR
jgi:signal transduction histidine kinase